MRLPTDCRWLASGDFNMIENIHDKSALCSKVMPQGEKIVWEAFKLSLYLTDTFNHNGRLRFSWDNRRRDGCRILGRLDRHYISSPPGLPPSLHARNYIIKGDCPASDHLPVTIEIVLQEEEQRKSAYKMNTAYLQHNKVKQEVTRIWTEDRSVQSTFFTRTRKFVRFYKQYCRNQAAVSRREEQVAKDSLAAAQATLQVDPQNAAAQLTLAQRHAQLLSFEAKKVEGCRLRARLKWKAKGDTMSREFFQAVRGKSPKTPIAELMSPNGEPITQQKDIERACVTFYKELYKAPERGEQHQQGERRILDAITARISPLMASSLGQPLSVSELHQAACALAKEKAPGPDGFSVNFFTLFWPLIGPDFH